MCAGTGYEHLVVLMFRPGLEFGPRTHAAEALLSFAQVHGLGVTGRQRPARGLAGQCSCPAAMDWDSSKQRGQQQESWAGRA